MTNIERTSRSSFSRPLMGTPDTPHARLLDRLDLVDKTKGFSSASLDAMKAIGETRKLVGRGLDIEYALDRVDEKRETKPHMDKIGPARRMAGATIARNQG